MMLIWNSSFQAMSWLMTIHVKFNASLFYVVLGFSFFRKKLLGWVLCSMFLPKFLFFSPVYHHKLTTSMLERYIRSQSFNCDVRITYNSGEENKLIFLHGIEWIVLTVACLDLYLQSVTKIIETHYIFKKQSTKRH